MSSLIEAYPPLGLRIVAGDLELRVPDDDLLVRLADLAAEGIHDPAVMPFAMPWTDGPAEGFQQRFVQHHWGSRAGFSPSLWNLDFAVLDGGELVGMQGVNCKDYLVTRSGETGSWLGRRFQGRRIGTRMRQAICAFLFDYLDAERITSGAFFDNPASLAVSLRVGYRRNGIKSQQRRPGERAEHQDLLLLPEDFVRGEPIYVEGVAGLRRMIGLD